MPYAKLPLHREDEGERQVIKCLSLGAGNLPLKRKLFLPQTENAEIEWTTLDIDPACKPDIIFDLNDMERGLPLPIADDTFDEIHAYSVMALYGQQGNASRFFAGMRELWMVLKPGGLFIGGTPAPADRWAWGEPSAVRIINDATFLYLTKDFYKELGHQPLSDYRSYVDPCWWTIEHSEYLMIGDCQTYHWALRKDVGNEVG